MVLFRIDLLHIVYDLGYLASICSIICYIPAPRAGPGKILGGHAEMQLCWEDASSGEQVSLTEFGFVFHDFDNGGSTDPTKDWCEERLTVHDPASYSTSETARTKRTSIIADRFADACA